jgi:hypothetical protein
MLPQKKTAYSTVLQVGAATSFTDEVRSRPAAEGRPLSSLIRVATSDYLDRATSGGFSTFCGARQSTPARAALAHWPPTPQPSGCWYIEALSSTNFRLPSPLSEGDAPCPQGALQAEFR